jgi:hypothetical protein
MRMSIGEIVRVSIDNLRLMRDLRFVTLHDIRICVGRRQRPCVMIRCQPPFLEVVVSIVNDDMTVRTAHSERVHRDPAKAVRGPRSRFKRKLKSPFRCWDLWVDFFEVDVGCDESILEDKDRLDDTNPC